ncbi:MAG: 4Fe-4S binding protein [Promethearchaeota archaeon]
MYPRVKIFKNNVLNEVKLNFYTESYSIGVDKEKCIGCGLCIKTCPNNAYTYPNLDGKIRVKTDDLIPDAPNAMKCSYCGTCAYICPMSAISLKYNDKPIDIKDLGIITKNVVPTLNYKIVKLKNNQNKVKVYLDGEIGVDWEKCISCMSCIDVCPSKAFFKTKNQQNNNSTKNKVSFHQSSCISCGTCVRACPKKVINLRINNVFYSGDYKKIFWEPLLSRIKS